MTEVEKVVYEQMPKFIKRMYKYFDAVLVLSDDELPDYRYRMLVENAKNNWISNISNKEMISDKVDHLFSISLNETFFAGLKTPEAKQAVIQLGQALGEFSTFVKADETKLMEAAKADREKILNEKTQLEPRIEGVELSERELEQERQRLYKLYYDLKKEDNDEQH